MRIDLITARRMYSQVLIYGTIDCFPRKQWLLHFTVYIYSHLSTAGPRKRVVFKITTTDGVRGILDKRVFPARL